MKHKIALLVAVSIAAAFASNTFIPLPAWSSDGAREWKSPTAASERKNPVRPDQKSIASGRAVYQSECASCHGTGGRGDGKDGLDLNTRPADLSSPPVTAQSDGALFWKVTTGRRPMPGFRKDLSDEERWNLVNFIRTLTPRR